MWLVQITIAYKTYKVCAYDLIKPNNSKNLTAEKKQHLVCESYGDMGCQVSE